MKEVIEFLKRNIWTVVCVLIAVVLTILILEWGLWKTILLGIMLAIAIFIGMSIDKRNNGKSDGFN